MSEPTKDEVVCQRCDKTGGRVVSFKHGSLSESRWVCPHCLDAYEERGREIERLRAERPFPKDWVAISRSDLDKLKAERDEARATMDMHKERQQDEIGPRLKAEARLARVVKALEVEHRKRRSCGGPPCPTCDLIAAAQPEEKP